MVSCGRRLADEDERRPPPAEREETPPRQPRAHLPVAVERRHWSADPVSGSSRPRHTELAPHSSVPTAISALKCLAQVPKPLQASSIPVPFRGTGAYGRTTLAGCVMAGGSTSTGAKAPPSPSVGPRASLSRDLRATITVRVPCSGAQAAPPLVREEQASSIPVSVPNACRAGLGPMGGPHWQDA